MTVIRPAFAKIIAEKLARPGVTTVNGDAIRPALEQAVQTYPTKTGDEVELNFEKVSKAIASLNIREALDLKDRAPAAVQAFDQVFAAGAGAVQNHSFEGYGDGIFSVQGGSKTNPDVTFMVDTSPGQDGIQWLVLDNTKLPKKDPRPVAEPAVCYQPPLTPEPVPASVGIEPWMSGNLSDTPAVGSEYAARLTGGFGQQALTSIEDSRIRSCAGYYFDGLEGMRPSQDWLAGITTANLGDQWKMTKPGTYELTNGEMGQILKFDSDNRQTMLESYYDVHEYDVSRYREILRLDQDGTVRREIPPVGI